MRGGRTDEGLRRPSASGHGPPAGTGAALIGTPEVRRLRSPECPPRPSRLRPAGYAPQDEALLSLGAAFSNVPHPEVRKLKAGASKDHAAAPLPATLEP